VAFVLVLMGALIYRSVDVSTKRRAVPAPQVVSAPATPTPPAPAVTQDPPPPQSPNQAVPKQGGLVAQVRGTTVRPASNTRTQKTPADGSQAQPETADAAPQLAETPLTDPPAVAKEVEANAHPPEEVVSPPLATMPEASAEDGPAENRGKRMIKAVGRFLRIGGKKEVEPQPAPARPKPNQQ
jgi:hypothetical protein